MLMIMYTHNGGNSTFVSALYILAIFSLSLQLDITNADHASGMPC